MAIIPESQRDKLLLLACVAAAGLVYVYYAYMWSGKSAELTALSAHLDTLTQQNDSSRREIASGATARLQAEAEQYGTMLGVMRRLVPTANELPSLLDQISTAARTAGLEIGEVTPDSVIPGAVFNTYRYHMTVNGSYNRVGELMSNIGSLTRIVEPMNLNLTINRSTTTATRKGEASLAAGFDIETYVAKSGQPTSAAPPAPTTTKAP